MDAKTTSHTAPSWLGRTLMAVGISGAAFAALCCVAPFMVAGLVTALGLGFMLNDALLIGFLWCSSEWPRWATTWCGVRRARDLKKMPGQQIEKEK